MLRKFFEFLEFNNMSNIQSVVPIKSKLLSEISIKSAESCAC